MDFGETKKWLNRGRTLQAEIRSLEQAKAEAEARVTKIVVPPKKVIVQSTKDERRDSGLVEYAESDYVGQINRRIVDLNGILDEISRAIYAVDNGTLRQILIARYILFRSFEEIAVDMHYGYRNVMKLHKRAVQTISRLRG